jgi:hypothetical protein
MNRRRTEMTANASPKAAGTEEQYSLTKILGIWVAAAAPMPILWCVLAVILLISCARATTEWVRVDETDHFIFFATNGAEDAVPLLAQELEANYDRITRDLQITAAGKFPVYIFEDIDTFHRAEGRPDASPSSIGTVRGIDIWLVSPLNPGDVLDTQEVLTAGVHEFTHALVNYINGSLDKNNYEIPIWLNEGLAGYEAGQMTPDWRARIAQRVADEAVPSISTDLVPDRFHQAGGLAFSITLVEYMIEQYGFEEIIAIIKAPSEVETILGITLSDLDLAWHEYLREAYP